MIASEPIHTCTSPPPRAHCPTSFYGWTFCQTGIPRNKRSWLVRSICLSSTMIGRLMLLLDTSFPTDLPKPEDDGAAKHLTGTSLPSFSLPSTAGNLVDLSTLSGLTVVFCYPRTGAPGETITEDWNSIPGARGCTPQACSFRDASAEFLSLGVTHIFGASTQDTSYQQEAKTRNQLPFQLLSDEKLEMIKALRLPTFDWKGTTLTKRLSMVIEDGKIVQVVSC